MPIYKLDKKKDGQQCYRVRINYKDNDGKYRQLTRIATGLAEAKLLETELQLSLKEKTPEVRKAENQTIEDLYNNYIENKKYEVRETSIEKSKTVLKKYVLPYLGDTRINSLSLPTLTEWKNNINKLQISHTHKKNIYAEFRALLNFAVKNSYLQTNPLIKIGNFKNPYEIESKEKINYYTPEEFTRYISTAKKHTDTVSDFGIYALFCILYFTGARKGEANALQWSDFQDDLIHIRKSVSQKLKGGDRITPPKNKHSHRTVQAPETLIKILNELKERQRAVPGWSEDFYICGGPRPIRDTTIENRNTLFAKEANLFHIRIHDFRHSHASLLANEGINIQEIARRLGHSNVEMTWNTYSHLYPREEERAVAILNTIKI